LLPCIHQIRTCVSRSRFMARRRNS
jgi:hypothetical protein